MSGNLRWKQQHSRTHRRRRADSTARAWPRRSSARWPKRPGASAASTAPPRLVTSRRRRPASAVYVRNKVRTCEELGLASSTTTCRRHARRAPCGRWSPVQRARRTLTAPRAAPAPEARTRPPSSRHIDPAKDVDGSTPVTVGRMMQRRPTCSPAPHAGIVELLVREGVKIAGARPASSAAATSWGARRRAADCKGTRP